jgi:triosephosphate isomerase (TIM)
MAAIYSPRRDIVRTPLIVGNWKMNKTASEAAAFVRELSSKLTSSAHAEVVLAPPFTALESVRTALGPSSKIQLGAQNLHWEARGAFTGEVSGPMLRDVGCTFVIVGHSERRTLFGERDVDIQKKVGAALAHGLCPILCIGESLKEREADRTDAIVIAQLTAALAGMTVEELSRITIAYEPVWAIGTGRAATTDQAIAVHRIIRAFVAKGWGQEAAARIRILYGGSVTPQNAESLLNTEEIDGALIGGACLKSDSFATIVAAAQHTSRH